jgi:uncharacterized DUF497 family protein
VCILIVVAYEWDPNKARGNRRKHAVDFADAALVLEDPLGLTQSDPDAEGEDRFVTLGEDPGGQLLVVVWSPRGEDIRLFSARRATAAERRQYEER